MKFYRFISTLVALILMVCMHSVFGQTKTNQTLFEYSTAGGIAAPLSRQQLSPKYSIVVNAKASAMSTGEVLNFPLPSGVVLNISITQKKFAKNGDVIIVGDYENGGVAVITFGDKATFANFSRADHSYGISIDSNQQQLLIDHKSSSYDTERGEDMPIAPNFEPMRHLNQAKSSSQVTGQKLLSNGKYEVALLAVYSPEFAAGFSSATSRINQMIAFTNDAYDRSGVNIELTLAHATQIAFTNGASTGTLLTQVTNGTNAFSGVAALRDQYHADLVAVLPFVDGNSISGIAWLFNNSERTTHSVSQFAQFGSDSLFAHEIGHNLGSGHERISANASQPDPCTGGYTGYSCGHGNGTQGTIMSYLNDLAWGFVFSNPALDCNGEPCGIANGQTNAADNRTSFNITAPLVSSIRVDESNDDDNDGVENDDDNCPNVANADQLNTDNDSFGDACDQDDDNDGVNDPIDNCPLIANADQQDLDDNDIGDACQDEIIEEEAQDEMCFPVTGNNNVSVICL